MDVAFIRAVEVEKMTNATSGNAGSLGGKVEFRTVSAVDLIPEGANKGGEVNVSRGTNGYDFQGSVLAAVREPDGPSPLLPVTAVRSWMNTRSAQEARHEARH